MGASSRQLPTRYAGPVSTVLWLWNPLGPGVLCKIICEIQQTKGKWKIVRLVLDMTNMASSYITPARTWSVNMSTLRRGWEGSLAV